jgi:MSHA pilin protein MshA
MMNNKGLTLIELVVVIVILGVLAVTAVPKYINLKADAQTATLDGVKSAMQGASAFVYRKSIVKGNQKLSSSNIPNPTITLTDGTELRINYGYPRSKSSDWREILDLDSNDFSRIESTISPILRVFPKSLGNVFLDTAPCIVTYMQATLTSKPIITVNPCV